ncbi:hypothetical protein WA588_002480, partial [Blastocystis sp. NMH]
MNTFQDAENRINRVGIETFVSQAFESVRLDSDSESKNPFIPRILSLSPLEQSIVLISIESRLSSIRPSLLEWIGERCREYQDAFSCPVLVSSILRKCGSANMEYPDMNLPFLHRDWNPAKSVHLELSLSQRRESQNDSVIHSSLSVTSTLPENIQQTIHQLNNCLETDVTLISSDAARIKQMRQNIQIIFHYFDEHNTQAALLPDHLHPISEGFFVLFQSDLLSPDLSQPLTQVLFAHYLEPLVVEGDQTVSRDLFEALLQAAESNHHLFSSCVLLPALQKETLSQRSSELVQRMLKSSLPQRVKEALGMSIVESEDLVADARLFPVIRVALTNDPSRSLSAEALVRFFSRCVGSGRAMQTASLWSLMRFFLKEYATQCVPFKTTLTTMMESAEDSQPLVRVLRSMIAK